MSRTSYVLRPPSFLVRLLSLGQLSLVGDDGQPVSNAAAQPRRLALLAVLARSAPKAVSREKLIAWFWPDSDEEQLHPKISPPCEEKGGIPGEVRLFFFRTDVLELAQRAELPKQMSQFSAKSAKSADAVPPVWYAALSLPFVEMTEKQARMAILAGTEHAHWAAEPPDEPVGRNQ